MKVCERRIIEYKVRFEATTKTIAELEQKLKDADARIKEMSIGDPAIQMLEQDIESQTELVRTLDQKIAEWKVLERAGHADPGREAVTRKCA